MNQVRKNPEMWDIQLFAIETSGPEKAGIGVLKLRAPLRGLQLGNLWI